MLGVGSTPVVIPPSYQDMKILYFDCTDMSRSVKIRNTSEAVLKPQYTINPSRHTYGSHMGLGQYNSLGEYCGSSVFLKLIFHSNANGFGLGPCIGEDPQQKHVTLPIQTSGFPKSLAPQAQVLTWVFCVT